MQINNVEYLKKQEREEKAYLKKLDKEIAKRDKPITVTWNLIDNGKAVQHTETIPASLYCRRLKEYGNKEHNQEFIDRYNSAVQPI